MKNMQKIILQEAYFNDSIFNIDIISHMYLYNHFYYLHFYIHRVRPFHKTRQIVYTKKKNITM